MLERGLEQGEPKSQEQGLASASGRAHLRTHPMQWKHRKLGLPLSVQAPLPLMTSTR